MALSDSPLRDLVEAPILERVLHEALRREGDFAELFVEDRSSSSILLDDRKVEQLSTGRDRGAGIRVIVGETTGFAHTADLSEAGLLSAARAAATVARETGADVHTIALSPQSPERQRVATP
ncbi:MAG: DNA gyrase modulator [Acidimicrobiales bacterium]|jgi:TldD protein